MKRRHDLGFTLIEVAVALAILAMSLSVLLEVQATSLHNATRTRGLTLASLLARSKMIDVEQKLFDEGFTMGEDTADGDFEEEGHPEIKWSYRISELEIDLSSLTSMCGAFGESEGNNGTECESMLGAFGAPLESLTDELGRSLRLVELTVKWPDGKFEETMSVHAMVTREDFALQPAELPEGITLP